MGWMWKKTNKDSEARSSRPKLKCSPVNIKIDVVATILI
jgi:hypothetical protein